MKGAMRVVDSETFAKRVQAVLLARKLLARESERIDDAFADAGRRGLRQALEFSVEKGKVERRVMDDPVCTAREFDQFGRDVGEARLVAQRLPGQPVDIGRAKID